VTSAIAESPPHRRRTPAKVQDLGRREYGEVWEVQKQTVARRLAGEIPDTLLLVEHDEVITVGRGARDRTNLLDAAAIPVFEVERGGDVTYHGPGQLVGYPIFLLRESERDLHRFLRNIEQALIDAVARFGIHADRRAGLTGLWVGDRKLASIGIAVRRWVTWHGFALNLTTDLLRFLAIRPCGLPADVMTSMEALLGHAPARAEVAGEVAAAFSRVFGRDFR